MEKSEKAALEELVFDLITFIVTSAQLCAKEPPLYGSFRLLDVARRLIDISERITGFKKTLFLEKIRKEIEEKMWILQYDLEGFKKFLDDLVIEFAYEIKKTPTA